MTIRKAIENVKQALLVAQVPDPEQDARMLLSFVTGLPRLMLCLSGDTILTHEQEQRFSSLLLLRVHRQPLQYLLGEQCFFGFDFLVDSRVLIPRQETETLCELGIAHLCGLCALASLNVAMQADPGSSIIHSTAQHSPSPTALDLCTGSGAIAITLKHECPVATVTATDLSPDALSVARKNAVNNGVDIRFLQGDLLVPVASEHFDLILSNPPYIPSLECETLQAEVMYEPRIALDGGKDGLDFYRRIVHTAHTNLTVNGLLAMEVGDTQAGSVAALLNESEHYREVYIHKDLYGHERIVCAKLRHEHG